MSVMGATATSERMRIVKWLREIVPPTGTTPIFVLADAVEAGEHWSHDTPPALRAEARMKALLAEASQQTTEFALHFDAFAMRQLNAKYQIGDLVEKTGGDYSYRGWVVGVVVKRSGVLRYVVENDDGMLFIFNEKALEKVE